MQFHDPKNMAISIAIEASELLQEFQWKNEKETEELIKDNKDRVQDEIADVALYLFELADNLDIDLIEAMNVKMKKNEIKYPIKKSKGNAKKYTEL
jgi:dCTP diphosphatase